MQSQSSGTAVNIIKSTLNENAFSIGKCIELHGNGKITALQNAHDYCAHDERIAYHIRKDVVYLDKKMKNNPKAKAERNITAPKNTEKPAETAICLGNGDRNVFWPNIKNPDEICQNKNVIAMIECEKRDGENRCEDLLFSSGTRLHPGTRA